MEAQAERVIMFSSESVIEGHLFADPVEISFALVPARRCTCAGSSAIRWPSMQTDSFKFLQRPHTFCNVLSESMFELDLVFDIDRALSVFDCDRY